MIESKYFAEAEFQRCSPACSLQDMNRAFIWMLDAIREEAGIPLVLTCAYRSKEHDIANMRDKEAEMRDEMDKLRSENTALTIFRCDKVGCADRKPPFAYQVPVAL